MYILYCPPIAPELYIVLGQVLNIKIDDEAEVQKMLEAMKSAASVMDNSPISMTFAGVKRFGSSVVYAAMTEGLDAVRALYASLQARNQNYLPRPFRDAPGYALFIHLSVITEY